MPLAIIALPNPDDERFSGRLILSGQELSIGRASSNDWVLEDRKRTISKRHCVIRAFSGKHEVVDTSTNGVFCNGRQIEKNVPQTLQDGDEISISTYKFKVEVQDAEQDNLNISTLDNAPAISAILNDVTPADDNDLPLTGAKRDAFEGIETGKRQTIPIGWQEAPSTDSDIIKPADNFAAKNMETANRLNQVPVDKLLVDMPAPKASQNAEINEPEIGGEAIIPTDWYENEIDVPNHKGESIAPDPDPASEIIQAIDVNVEPPKNIDLAPTAPGKATAPAQETSATQKPANLSALADGLGVDVEIFDGIDPDLVMHNAGRALSLSMRHLMTMFIEINRASASSVPQAEDIAHTPWIFSLAGENRGELNSHFAQFLADSTPRDLQVIANDFESVEKQALSVLEGSASFAEDIAQLLDIKALERDKSGTSLALPAFKKAACWDKLKSGLQKLDSDASNDEHADIMRIFSKRLEAARKKRASDN